MKSWNCDHFSRHIPPICYSFKNFYLFRKRFVLEELLLRPFSNVAEALWVLSSCEQDTFVQITYLWCHLQLLSRRIHLIYSLHSISVRLGGLRRMEIAWSFTGLFILFITHSSSWHITLIFRGFFPHLCAAKKRVFMQFTYLRPLVCSRSRIIAWNCKVEWMQLQLQLMMSSALFLCSSRWQVSCLEKSWRMKRRFNGGIRICHISLGFFHSKLASYLCSVSWKQEKNRSPRWIHMKHLPLGKYNVNVVTCWECTHKINPQFNGS